MNTYRCGHEQSPENTTPKGRCRTCRRTDQRAAAVTETGRARRRRADRKYKDAGKELVVFRKRKYGATPEDIARLLEQQRGPDGVARCPFCGEPVTEKDALDHAWGQVGADALRGIAHRTVCNPAFGRTDEELDARALRLLRYAGKRKKLRARRACPTLRKDNQHGQHQSSRGGAAARTDDGRDAQTDRTEARREDLQRQ